MDINLNPQDRGPIHRPFAVIMAGGDITSSLFYVLGPDRWVSVSNFDVLRQLPVPIRAWMLGILIAGVVILAADHWIGYCLGAMCLTVLTVSTAATLATTASAGGGPAWFGMISALHYLGIYVRARRLVTGRRLAVQARSAHAEGGPLE